MKRSLPTALAFCFLTACMPTEAEVPNTTSTKTEAVLDDKDEPAKVEKVEKHFDIEKDKSGVLARTAAVLETQEGIDSEDLRELSHHAEAAASVEALCKQIGEIRKSGDDDDSKCVKDMEHHVVRLGPELYAQLSACIMEGKTAEDLDACEAAELEAEEALHNKPHGEGLDAETCTKFFDHYEKLAMEDAGEEHAEHVKEILEEVRGDVETACKEQGAKKEVDCALNSKTLHEIKECASLL